MICTRCTSHCTEFCPAGYSLRPSLFNSELPQGTLPGSTLGDLGFSMSLGHEPVAHTTRPKKWMPWKFQTVGLRAASCNLKAEPKQLGSVWIRGFDEYQTQTQQVSVGCCSSLLRCLGWGPPNLTQAGALGLRRVWRESVRTKLVNQELPKRIA